MKKIDDMKFALNWMQVKASWFDHQINKKKRKITQIGYDGFNLYINLFRFLVRNQDRDYTFVTSIDFMRKVTGYSGEDVLLLFKKLDSKKVLNFVNISKWTYIYNEDGSIKVDKTLIIQATDVPETVERIDENKRKQRLPKTEDDYFIDINLELFQMYKDAGLSERCYPLYCLIRKLSNNMEHVAFMTIEKMADTIGMNKDTVNKLIYEMNRKYFLYSRKRDNKKEGRRFEHVICRSAKHYQDFVDSYRTSARNLVSKWDKKQANMKLKKQKKEERLKQQTNQSEELNELENVYDAIDESESNLEYYEDEEETLEEQSEYDDDEHFDVENILKRVNENEEFYDSLPFAD